MASLELGELAHEGSSDIGIDFAVKKDWPARFLKLRGELMQLFQRADGRSLKSEALRDRRKIHIREHRFSHGLLPEPQKMQLCAVGTIVHQHYHYRQILSHDRLELSHRHQKAAVTDTLKLALQASGLDQATVMHRPRLLSDNGSSYVSGDLAKWLERQDMVPMNTKAAL